MEASGWNAQRVTALVRLAVQVASTVAGGFGLALDADSATTVLLCAVAAASGIYNWWKNQNVTKAAQAAQGYLDEIKKGAGE